MKLIELDGEYINADHIIKITDDGDQNVIVYLTGDCHVIMRFNDGWTVASAAEHIFEQTDAGEGVLLKVMDELISIGLHVQYL